MNKYLPRLAEVLKRALATAVQSRDRDIAGIWVLDGFDKLLPDGTHVSELESDFHGLVIFTLDGYYSFQIHCTDPFRSFSGDRIKSTSRQFQGASLGMSVHFGRYTLNRISSTVILQIDRALFPHRNDITQVHALEMKRNLRNLETWERETWGNLGTDGTFPFRTR